MKFYGYLYAIMSIISLLTTREEANLTGLVFLIFSLYLFRTHFLSAIITLSTFIVIGTKVFFGFSGNQILALVLGYGYCLIVYYILIHPKPKQPKIVYCPHLDEIDIQIVQNLYQSCIYKEIAPLVDLKEGAVARRVSRMRKRMDVGSTQELIVKCLQMSYISDKVDNPTNL